jgi:hypothetical protein
LAKIAAGNNKEPELSYYNLSNSAEGENIWFWTEKKRDLYNGEAPQKSSEIDKSKDLPKDQEKTILSLKGKTHLGFPVKNYTVSDSTQLILEFSPDYIKDISDYQPKPTALRAQDILEKEGERSVTISRKKKLAIGGIILETRDLVRNEKDFDTLRELELRKSLAQKKVNTKKSPQKTSENDLRVRGTIRLIFDDGSHKEIIYHASNFKRSLKTREPNIQLRENLLPFTGKTIKALEIKNDAGVVSIHSLKLEPRKKGKIFKYKNEINAAQDAVLHFGGVEIYRSSNDSLTDIIKGLKLTLLNSSTKNIKIDVRVDTETPRKAIEKFLESYNNFLELAGFYQKVEKEEEAGNFKRQKEKSGILVGDSTLARLVSDLKMMLTNPYPGTSDKAIRIFFHIGIATGKLRQSFEEIQKGQMKIIDDNKLEDQLANNYEEVKNFFGLDTTGDRKIDQGLAFKINNYLSNYTRSGRLGLIAAKLQLSDDRIKNLKETKERKLAHVENYREKLKRSFATMEQGMMRTKKEQQWLNNQMKGMGGDK